MARRWFQHNKTKFWLLSKRALGRSPVNDSLLSLGNDSSSQSPAMNFERSALLLRLYMERFPFNMLTRLTELSLYKSM